MFSPHHRFNEAHGRRKIEVVRLLRTTLQFRTRTQQCVFNIDTKSAFMTRTST